MLKSSKPSRRNGRRVRQLIQQQLFLRYNNIQQQQPIRFHDGVFFLEPLIPLTGDTAPTLWAAASKIKITTHPRLPVTQLCEDAISWRGGSRT